MKVRFSVIGRDLFWSVFNLEDGTIRWTGYDDRNWWENIAAEQSWRVQTGKNSGRTYTLNPLTDVLEVSE